MENPASLPDVPDPLAEQLRAPFLTSLVEAARHYGWIGDHVEIRQFVQWCYETGGLPIPTREQLAPYKD